MRTIKYYPSRVKAELKKYGKAYVQKKYGLAVYAKVTGQSLKKTAKGYVISKATGAKLDYHGKSKTSGRSIYAKDEDHKLHSHELGHNDMHKPGIGGIGNERSAYVNKGQQGARMSASKRSEKSLLNKPPKPIPGWKGPGPLSAFVEGGMADLAQGKVPFQRQMNFNLSNDEDAAQGSEHPWAQATSISHLISGQLRLASNQTVDAWEQWAADKTGNTEITRRGGSPFGVDVNFNPDFGEQIQAQEDDYGGMSAGTQLAQSNPMGAFGTSSVMYDLGENPEMIEQAEGDPFWTRENDVSGNPLPGSYQYATGVNESTMYDPKKYTGERHTKTIGSMTKEEYWWLYYNEPAFRELYKKHGGDINKMGGIKWILPKGEYSYTPSNIVNGIEMGKKPVFQAPSTTTPNPTGPGTDDEPYKQTPLPNYNTGEGGDAFDLPDNFTPTSDVYNPWAYGEGGEYNMQGPSSARMGQATMEAMALANAYFAPQRAELAYELGDMETDMRRLAVNLGRQVDDPVLQAKLYKEASRAVRTLDIQQNTYAFQMADARRKEELNNWQFYDQLAQNEHQMRLANYQFMKTLDLQYSQYNLQNWQAQYAANQGLPNQPAPPSGGTTESMEDRYDYGSAKSVSPTITSSGGIYGTKRY